jgi:hypothetical protein
VSNVPWNPDEVPASVQTVRVAGVDLKAGDRVRLRPRKRADILDMLLEGKIATIEAIELDFDNQIHIAVVIDEDPGRDLGQARQIAHRFFYAPHEVEPLRAGRAEDSA